MLMGVNAWADSKYLLWFDSVLKVRKRIDLIGQIVEKENALGNWEKIKYVYVDKRITSALPPRVVGHFFALDKNTIRFTLAGTGIVYDFNDSTSTIERIDRTYYAGYNFGASKFIRKGILHSFGGSGFWNYSKALTYFSDKSKEWENIKSNNLGPNAIFNGFQGFSMSADLFYAGGSEYHDFLNAQPTIRDSHFYSFDFNANAWTYLGDILPELLEVKSREIVWSGRYFVQFSDDILYIIDPVANKVFKSKSATETYQAAPLMYSDNLNVIGYWDEEGGKRFSISLDEVLKQSYEIGPFYELPSKWLYYVGILLLILFSGLGVYYFIRKNQVTKVLSLEEQELILLKALFESEVGLNTVEINDLLGLSSKSIDNQRKLRLQVFSSINHKFYLKYKIETSIIRTPSAIDKRQLLYTLNPETAKHVSVWIR
jgi:hypothetical protein